jgi:hypothetical protein
MPIRAPLVATPDHLLGGLWAVVATVLVVRDTRDQSVAAGLGRLVATGVSRALCLVYSMI